MSDEVQDFKWEFLGFESPKEGQPVQSWYDTLPLDHRDEIKDVIGYLQVTPWDEWDEMDGQDFDPLNGEGGISEIRFRPIKCSQGKFYYRIYGYFGEVEEGSYKLLHPNNKKVKNDRQGKGIAKRRLRELESEEATLHPFNMD
jgi:hypothetical protein